MYYTCDKCGRRVPPSEIGYLGPRDREDDHCNPFQDFECVCVECEYKLSVPIKETT